MNPLQFLFFKDRIRYTSGVRISRTQAIFIVQERQPSSNSVKELAKIKQNRCIAQFVDLYTAQINEQPPSACLVFQEQASFFSQVV